MYFESQPQAVAIYQPSCTGYRQLFTCKMRSLTSYAASGRVPMPLNLVDCKHSLCSITALPRPRGGCSRGRGLPIDLMPAIPSSMDVQVSTRSACICYAQQGGGLGDEEGVDVAVFRFTLGIPGFEDRLIPRVVGAVGAALLALNHILGAQPAPAAQVRAEYLCLSLAVLCVVVPEVEERLKEALPGRGRQRMADSIAGATNGLFIASKMSDDIKKELAWASSALIKNTNSCGVVILHEGQPLLARGAIGSSVAKPGQAQATLDAVKQDLQRGLQSGSEVLAPALASSSSGELGQVYLPDRQAMDKAQASKWATLPSGAQSVCITQIPSAGATGAAKPSCLIVFSERPRALSDKERQWASAVASKLALAL